MYVKEENHPIGVQVIQHSVDWDNLSRSTLQRLGDGGELLKGLPGQDRVIAACFRFTMQQADQFGTRYVNPKFTVMAPGPSPAFLRRARQAQRAWLKTLKTVLGKSGILKREIRKRLPEVRQLEFTGVMIIDGKHVHPQQWPKNDHTSVAIDLVGRQFGRLTVVRRVPGGRWLCNCACGGQNTVRTKHLLHGRVRSCGCLKVEKAAEQAERKANRAWRQSGILS